jgi:multidrug efflux pump subunit AcrB
MGGFSEFAVRRWQFTLVVFFGLIAIGWRALSAIPKSEDPSFAIAVFVVVGVMPGASPEDVERLVVDPVESRLGQLDDVKRIRSEIDDGLGITQVEFRDGVDADRKRDDVLREVNALRPTLPQDVVRLDVTQVDNAKVNVMEVALVSDDVRYHTLDAVARDLKKRLEAVAGVGHVEISGLPRQEATVALDLERLVALGVSPAELLDAVHADAQNVPAGAVEVASRRFNVKTSGDYASPRDIEDTVVRTAPEGGAVRVRDVATVTLGDGETDSIARFNGHRAVLVATSMREGSNLLELQPRLVAELDAFGASLPSGVRLERGFDQSHNVVHRLSGFTRDFGLAVLLVLVTLLPLGPRASLVVMVSIPLSLAVGVAILHLLGFSINQLSVVGFVIALGLLVDDSIVVVENIARHIRQGESVQEAAVRATQQITLSVLGCTATLILSFVPILALPGSAGLFIRALPVAVIASVGSSLLVSLTVVPFMASILLRPEPDHGNRFFRALTTGIETLYRPVLTRALRSPRATVVLSFALVAASVALVPRIGFGLFPKAGIPQFVVQIETEDGSSLPQTDRVARFVEGVLTRHPEVRWTSTTVGKGHPQVYYNVTPRDERVTVADVVAELEPMGHDRSEALADVLRSELAGYPGAHIEVHEFANGPPLEAPIAMRLLGDDQAAICEAAARVESVLAAVSGTRDVRNPCSERRNDLRVRIDRDRAAVLGVPVPDVDRAVRLAIGGVVAGSYHEAGSDEVRDIRVIVARSAPSSVGGGARPTLDVLDRVFVPSARQAALPLSQVADVSFEASPTTIRHYDRVRAATVTAEVMSGHNTDVVTREVIARLGQVELPPHVRLVVAGEVESRQESFGGMGLAVIVATFGLLAVLVLEFRTFRSTLIVASVMPLGAIGGLSALWLSGYPLSFTASIGFIALMGIEVKNSILLVDFTNHLRERGVALDVAIAEAGEARFVPVLFTTLTALGGLVPLVLEHSSLYSPLAVVLVGGLVSSTLLARIVTPVVYRLLPPDLQANGSPDVEPAMLAGGASAE